jgi:hypothetical protein
LAAYARRLAGTLVGVVAASADIRRQAERPSLARTIVTRPIAAILVLMMAVGSIVLWIGIPVGWVWVASRTVKTSQPTLGPYLLVLCATPITMWIWGKLLFRLNDVYGRLTGQTPEVRTQLPWHKSMRGERNSGRQTTVLDLVMIVSVSVALTAFGIWFFFFAGSSIPGA